jgi:hypothetical protein
METDNSWGVCHALCEFRLIRLGPTLMRQASTVLKVAVFASIALRAIVVGSALGRACLTFLRCWKHKGDASALPAAMKGPSHIRFWPGLSQRLVAIGGPWNGRHVIIEPRNRCDSMTAG